MKTPIIRTVLLRAALLLSTLLAPLAVEAQVSPYTNPTYIPTQILPPTTVGTGASTTVFNNNGSGAMVLSVSGTFTGLTSTVQGTAQRTGTPTWTSVPVVPVGTSTFQSTITAAGQYKFDITGFAQIRLSVTALSTGSAVIAASATPSSPATPSTTTSGGQLLVQPYADSASSWQATSGTTPLTTATSTAMKTAGAAGIRNYLTGISIVNTSATVSTTVTILDGATVIWTGYLPAMTSALVNVNENINFLVPLRGTAATAMNIQLGTTGANVYWSANGYTGP